MRSAPYPTKELPDAAYRKKKDICHTETCVVDGDPGA